MEQFDAMSSPALGMSRSRGWGILAAEFRQRACAPLWRTGGGGSFQPPPEAGPPDLGNDFVSAYANSFFKITFLFFNYN